jgi:hypothetical protein
VSNKQTTNRTNKHANKQTNKQTTEQPTNQPTNQTNKHTMASKFGVFNKTFNHNGQNDIEDNVVLNEEENNIEDGKRSLATDLVCILEMSSTSRRQAKYTDRQLVAIMAPTRMSFQPSNVVHRNSVSSAKGNVEKFAHHVISLWRVRKKKITAIRFKQSRYPVPVQVAHDRHANHSEDVEDDEPDHCDVVHLRDALNQCVQNGLHAFQLLHETKQSQTPNQSACKQSEKEQITN